MKCLVDTQIFILIISNPNKLPARIIEYLSKNEVYISHISFYEIAIKQKIGKLPELSLSIEQLVNQAKIDNFNLMPITIEHITNYNSIPFFDNHRDPFDRLLLSTSFHENIPIVSLDENFKLYKDYGLIIS